MVLLSSRMLHMRITNYLVRCEQIRVITYYRVLIGLNHPLLLLKSKIDLLVSFKELFDNHF